MRNLKKILALVLALVMSFSLMATANAFTDSDKINDTYEEAVEVLSALKVFQGYENGSFVPQGSITRAEVATIIYRIVTGDVADKQVGIYADYNKFNDVKSTSWYAGYVNFCANAEYIKGYDAKTFGPNDPVTGYQALAMILRAVGYDKNGEFTGAGWQTQTAAVGKKLGITDNVSEGTLGVAATREVVAEILFRTIMVPQVEYTVAFGYQSIGQVSIGYETFGLAYAEGIVTGNQATGAAATVVSKDYVANTTTDLRFGTKTGLNMIGHSVKVWYNAKTAAATTGIYGTVYTVMDKSTAETVLTATELVGKVGTSTYYSNNYGPFSKGIHTPNVSKYIIIDAGKAVISVNETVQRIYAINNYAVTPTLTTTVDVNQGANGRSVYKQSELTGFDASTMAVNDFVIVTQIAGQRIFNLQKVEKTVTGIVRFSDSLGNVTLTDGTVLSRSAANVYTSAGNAGMPQAAAYSTLETYVFTLDADGRYIGSQLVGAGYLFGTYGYYLIDNAATAQMSYYLTGVDINGNVVTRQVNQNTYNNVLRNNIPTLDTANQNITQANAAGRDYALTQTITENVFAGAVYGNTTVQNVSTSVPGTQYVGNVTNNQDVVIRANTIAIGGQNNYFVDNNTKFVFISGTAAQPVTEIKTGITELLGGGDSYVIPGGATESVMSFSVLNYSVNTASNFHVDTIVVKAPYAANSAADLYYLSETDKADANVDGRADYVTTTNTTLGGVASTLIGVHKNGQALIYDTFVASNAVNGITTGRNNGAQFYTHAVNAAGVTTLTPVPAAGNNTTAPILAYYGNHIRAAGTSGLYITNNNGVIANRIAENAVIVDLRPNQVATGDAANGFVGTKELAAISDVNTLITKAAEYDFTVDAAGTASGMTIVYIKSAQIRDLSYMVNFVLTPAEAVQAGKTYYNILTGIGQSGQVAPYQGTVDFQLTADAAGAIVTYTVNGETKPLTAGSKLINGVVVNNVYTVTNITAPVTITITLPYTTGTQNGIVSDVTVNNVHLGAPAYAYTSLAEALAKAEGANLADQLAISPTSDITVTTKDGIAISGMSIGAYRTAPTSIATPNAVTKVLNDASLIVGDYIVITEVYNGTTYYMAYIVK